MRAAFAVALLVGLGMLLAWIIGVAVLDLDLDRRFGPWGRRLVGGVIGFGLGGMSAAFGGMSQTWSALAAVLAAGLSAWYTSVEIK